MLFDPTLNVYKACFLSCFKLCVTINVYDTPSTPFTASITHTLNKCRWPIVLSLSTAECCCYSLISYATSENQKFGSKLHFVWNQNKVQFCQKCPILHTKFLIFSGVIPWTPVAGEGDPLAHQPPSRAPFVITPL